MKITVIGTGYVGLIAGLGFAKWGNEVVCLDVIPEKIEKLQKGICPIYEPGAEVQLSDGLSSGRLRFTCDVKSAVEHGELIFIAVGTPEAADGSADLCYVYSAADEIADYMQSYKLVVDKSTVPVGTARALRQRIAERLKAMGKNIPFDVASNPEFLREGRAVGDFDNPDRIVLGVASERAEKLLRELYKVFSRSNKPVVVTTPETAEMIKYASNAFLATKITFINEIANLCEQVGANALEVAAAMGKDGRISPKFLHPGPGYGGSCFPKDTKALADTGKKFGAPMTVVESVVLANQRQKKLAAESNCVMDGRDIGTCVLPNAQLKIYLTASSLVRAKRRYEELAAKGEVCNLEKIRADIEERDYRDMHREISPLRQAEDAILIDSSDMTVEEVISRIISLVK